VRELKTLCAENEVLSIVGLDQTLPMAVACGSVCFWSGICSFLGLVY